MEPNDVKIFEEDVITDVHRSQTAKKRGLAGFLIRYGVAKSEEQAEHLSLIILGVLAVIILIVWMM